MSPPMYEYQCQKCENKFEVNQSIHAEPLTKCQECGAEGEVKRVIGNTSFKLVGSGWASDLYTKGNK